MEECAEMYVGVSALKLHCFLLVFFFVFFNPPDRTVLLVVGMACVLGFSTSYVALPGFSNHQEVHSFGFKSRTLLSTIDYAAIKVSN